MRASIISGKSEIINLLFHVQCGRLAERSKGKIEMKRIAKWSFRFGSTICTRLVLLESKYFPIASKVFRVCSPLIKMLVLLTSLRRYEMCEKVSGHALSALYWVNSNVLSDW